MQIEKDNVSLDLIAKDIAIIKQKLESFETLNPISAEWLPQKKVMQFLNYGATQMIAFEKKSGLIVSKIGKRKFVNVKSLNNIFEKNISSSK